LPDWVRTSARKAGLMAGIALIFAWFGVYDTYQMPLLPRFLFWFMTMVVGFGTAEVAVPWIREGAPSKWPVPAQIVLAAAIISVPVTIALLIAQGRWPTPFILLIQYGYVFIVSLVLSSLTWIYDQLRENQASGEEPDPVIQFLERLPVKYRGAELYAVSAEDHYLRVHTSVGEELILMRFSDAMKELHRAKGMQTHRSWWVANHGIADSAREDGKLVLKLKSGGKAAVSRTYAGAVKEAGLV